MGEDTKSLIELKAYSRHSDIYRWLRENFQRVSHDVLVLRRTWDAIAADVACAGVKGVRGTSPYAASVRRIWHRVVRDVGLDEERIADREREQQAKKAKRDAYPSRMSRDLRPIPSQQVGRPQQNALVVPLSTAPCERTPIDWETRFKAPSAEERQAKMERSFLWDRRSSWRFGENEREHHELRIEFDLEYREKWFKKHGSYDWDRE